MGSLCSSSSTTINARELTQEELDSISLQDEIARQYLGTIRSEAEWNNIVRQFALEQAGIKPKYETITTGGFTAGTPTQLTQAEYDALPADIQSQVRVDTQPASYIDNETGQAISEAEYNSRIRTGTNRSSQYTYTPSSTTYTLSGTYNPATTAQKLVGFELTEEGLARQEQERQARQLQTDLIAAQSEFLKNQVDLLPQQKKFLEEQGLLASEQTKLASEQTKMQAELLPSQKKLFSTQTELSVEQLNSLRQQNSLNNALLPVILENSLGLSMTQNADGTITLSEIADSDIAKYKEYSRLALDRAMKALKGELPLPQQLVEGWNLAEQDLRESLRKQFGSYESAMETEGGQRAWKNFLSAKSASFDAAQRGYQMDTFNMMQSSKPQYNYGEVIASKVPGSIGSNFGSNFGSNIGSNFGSNFMNPFQISPTITSPTSSIAGITSTFASNPQSWATAGGLAQIPTDTWANYRNYLGQVDMANAQISAGQSAGFGQLLGTAIGTAGGLYALCWVAEVLFGVNSPLTNYARFYASTTDNWFTKLYRKHGKKWAQFLKNKPIMQAMVRPIWLWMAYKGRRAMISNFEMEVI